MYKIYGIPACNSVKKAITYLDENNIKYEFYNYKKEGVTLSKLEEWLSQKPWDEIVNKKGTTWRALPDEEKPTNEKTAISLMLSKTSVIKRPIVELKNKIITLGFDLEVYQTSIK